MDETGLVDVTGFVATRTGYRIERHLSRHAYARNGNAHRPTPYYAWLVRDAAGRLQYTTTTRRDAKKFIEADLGGFVISGTIRTPRKTRDKS